MCYVINLRLSHFFDELSLQTIQCVSELIESFDSKLETIQTDSLKRTDSKEFIYEYGIASPD